MNQFESVKAAVTPRQVAEHYGLRVLRNGMTCCPFHQDKHPSMKVDDRYYCFGCHQTGDVIDFVSRLFSLTPYQAARKLAEDFGLHPAPDGAAALPVPKHPPAESARQREGRCVSALTACEQQLKRWKECYAPPDPEADWDARYTTACALLPQISYMLECLTSADAAERAWMADELQHDQTLEKISRILTDHAVDDAGMAA